MKKVIWLIFLSQSFTSCKKDVDPFANTSTSFHLPTLETLDSIAYLDTLKISGSIESNTEMHGYEITIKDTQNKVIEHMHEHIDAAEFQLDHYWVNDLTSTTTLYITVTVFLTHDSYDPVTEKAEYQCVAKGK